MAKKTSFCLMFFLAWGVFMVMLFVPAVMANYAQKETNITVYLHDYFGGPNPTDRVMVGFADKTWGFTEFGTIYIFDDLITEGPELTSPTVGRIQGFGAVASLDGVNAYIASSIVFTNKAYNDSTIQIQGGGNQLQPILEYSVVSGTGQFRYSTGYIIFETIFIDPSTSYALYRTNITIRH